MPTPCWRRAGAARVEAFVATAGATDEGRAGYFRFALDDPNPAARRLERIVAWRSRTLGLPYGDQWPADRAPGLRPGRRFPPAGPDGGCRSGAPPRPPPAGRARSSPRSPRRRATAAPAIGGAAPATCCAWRCTSWACRRVALARLYG
ncbi:MAG: hypothetical protein WDO24_21195 [Pseudomonadota bacterium]